MFWEPYRLASSEHNRTSLGTREFQFLVQAAPRPESDRNSYARRSLSFHGRHRGI